MICMASRFHGPRSHRHALAVAALLSLVGWPIAQAQTHSFAFSVNATSDKGPVNRQVLGSNVQWFNFGDSVLSGEGAHRPEVIERVVAQSPSVLRLWASDLFEWYLSLPDQQYVQKNLLPNGVPAKAQYTYFGSRQYLSFHAPWVRNRSSR